MSLISSDLRLAQSRQPYQVFRRPFAQPLQAVKSADSPESHLLTSMAE